MVPTLSQCGICRIPVANYKGDFMKNNVRMSEQVRDKALALIKLALEHNRNDTEQKLTELEGLLFDDFKDIELEELLLDEYKGTELEELLLDER